MKEDHNSNDCNTNLMASNLDGEVSASILETVLQNCLQNGNGDVPLIHDNNHQITKANPEPHSENEDVVHPVEAVTNVELYLQNVGESSTSKGNKKTRRQTKNIKEWKRNITKQQRMEGGAYTGYRRQDKKKTNVIIHDVNQQPRKLGPACNSQTCVKWKTRLCNTVTEMQRKTLFDDFWKKMSWDSKRMYVCCTVKVEESKQKTTKSVSRRHSTYIYHLQINGKHVPVCQFMYLNTLGLKKDFVHYWLKMFHKTYSNQSCDIQENSEDDFEETQVRNEDEPENSIAVQTKRTIAVTQKFTFLTQFFDSLPLLPSHYCRKSAKKNYLQSDIKTWNQLYIMYKEKCKTFQEGHLSRYSFDKIRKDRMIEIFQPKKSRCDSCLSLKSKNQSRSFL